MWPLRRAQRAGPGAERGVEPGGERTKIAVVRGGVGEGVGTQGAEPGGSGVVEIAGQRPPSRRIRIDADEMNGAVGGGEHRGIEPGCAGGSFDDEVCDERGPAQAAPAARARSGNGRRARAGAERDDGPASGAGEEVASAGDGEGEGGGVVAGEPAVGGESAGGDGCGLEVGWCGGGGAGGVCQGAIGLVGKAQEDGCGVGKVVRGDDDGEERAGEGCGAEKVFENREGDGGAVAWASGEDGDAARGGVTGREESGRGGGEEVGQALRGVARGAVPIGGGEGEGEEPAGGGADEEIKGAGEVLSGEAFERGEDGGGEDAADAAAVDGEDADVASVSAGVPWGVVG